MDKQWVVYILECKDGTLYTGITDRLQHRLAAHRTGKGAKYTRGRSPLVLRYVENCEDHSSALKREVAIKRLNKEQKWALCNTVHSPIEELCCSNEIEPSEKLQVKR